MILNEDGGPEHLSDTDKLINYLTAQAGEEGPHKISYVAYYHNIDNMTLLTVHQFHLRRDQECRVAEKRTVATKDNYNPDIEVECELVNAHGMVTCSKAKLSDEEGEQLAVSLNPIHECLHVGQ